MTTLRQREALRLANRRAELQATIDASLRLRAQETARGNRWANRAFILALICIAYIAASIIDERSDAADQRPAVTARR